MQIRPILSTLRRHKLTSFLLVLQVAFTCAIVTNAVFLIVQRVERAATPSGLDESGLSLVRINDLDLASASAGVHRSDAASSTSSRQPASTQAFSVHQADLAALRKLPGVESAALITNVPFSRNQHGSGGCVSLAARDAVMKARSLKVPGCAGADIYAGTPGTLRTLGLHLVAGQPFAAGDYIIASPHQPNLVPAIMVTRAFAKQLYPDHPDRIVGRNLYFGGGLEKGKPSRIVGVLAHLHQANVSGSGRDDQSVLLPLEPNQGQALFALRSKPADRAKVMKAAVAALNKAKPGREVTMDDAQTYAHLRASYFRRDTTMIRMLLAAALGLLFVTALGISGLASFWVGQRRRSIGIRRAIGATRGSILRYFQTENFLIVSVGVALGVVLAVALNLLLLQHYELAHLPLAYLVIGALVLWALGQISVLAPALRAARVPPVVATRSV